jgi:hypothetical protein
MRFQLSDYEPTSRQLNQINAAVAQIQGSGRVATESDWRTVVFGICPSAGTYKRAGVDNSDLNTLLALATKSAGE